MEKIQKVMANINQLSSELKIVNDRIDSYISYFEYLKNLERDNHITLTINVNSFNSIKEDKSLFVKNFNVYFNVGAVSFRFLFDDRNIKFNSTEVPFKLISIIYNIISKIEEKLNFVAIQKDIEDSKSIYFQIEKLYQEYNNLANGYTENSSIIISHFKEIVKKQSAKDDNTSFYLSFKRDNKRESLDISIKSYYDPNFFQLSLPTLESIKNKYLEKNQHLSFIRTQFEIVFKEEFFLLNQDFFQIFNIKQQNIKFQDRYLKEFDNSLYRKSIISGLSFTAITKNHIKLLAEQIKMKNIIVNF